MHEKNVTNVAQRHKLDNKQLQHIYCQILKKSR